VAVLSDPEQAAVGEAPSVEAPCEVTIVAHDIGPVGGMERVLSELILGLRERGERVTVIARTCELPAARGSCWRARWSWPAVRGACCR
jgi:hypothetical protein